MARVNERLTKLEAVLQDNNDTVHKIEQALYGNGKPGLLSDFRVLKDSVEQHHREYDKRLEEEKRRRKEKKLDWQWIITALIAIGGIVTAILK